MLRLFKTMLNENRKYPHPCKIKYLYREKNTVKEGSLVQGHQVIDEMFSCRCPEVRVLLDVPSVRAYRYRGERTNVTAEPNSIDWVAVPCLPAWRSIELIRVYPWTDLPPPPEYW